MKARGRLAISAAALCLLGAAALPIAPRLIWNRTASVPEGLYLVAGNAAPSRGGLVAYQPAPTEAAWLEAQGYTGAGWPLIKRARALEGDEVCRIGGAVEINSVPAARVLEEDAAGRALPAWSGCRRLGPGEIFLLGDHPRSVDGRYFGVQERARLLGAVRPVWAREQPGEATTDAR